MGNKVCYIRNIRHISEEKSISGWSEIKYCKSTGFVPEKIQYFDDVNSMELALYGGTGVALIYYEFFRNSSGHLKKIPLEPEAYVVGNRFMVAYPKNRYLQFKGFLKYLLEDTKG